MKHAPGTTTPTIMPTLVRQWERIIQFSADNHMFIAIEKDTRRQFAIPEESLLNIVNACAKAGLSAEVLESRSIGIADKGALEELIEALTNIQAKARHYPGMMADVALGSIATIAEAALSRIERTEARP